MRKTAARDTTRKAQIPAEADPSDCTALALNLMSHYAEYHCPLVAHAVSAQLGALSRHCGNATARMASALMTRWQTIAGGAVITIRH